MGWCSQLMNDIIPYVNNAMLAAILSLLIVILFVLLLHVYARWFLGHAHARSHNQSSISMTQIFGPARNLTQTTTTTYTYDITSLTNTNIINTTSKGLDRTAIDSIPMFIYERSNGGKECSICLSIFEERQVGRSLPTCSHAFHVDCIDMWFFSHSTCPVCRAHVHVDHHHPTVEIQYEDHHDGDSTVEIVVDDNGGGDEREVGDDVSGGDWSDKVSSTHECTNTT